MKLGDTIFNGNQFKNIILNSVSFKRLILEGNLVWSYFSIAIKTLKTRILADGGTYEGESILEDRLQEITPNLFDSASLVITPNGVKTSKLYSIKPNDGTGDLDVVRATSATRVDENGLIEIPATNLVLQSDMFADATWIKTNTTVSANTIISPSGLQDADTIIANGFSGTHDIRQNVSLIKGITYTLSIFAKKGTNNFIQLIGGATVFGSDVWATFDLDNGIVGSTGSLTTASIQSVGNGWFRCSITGASTIGTSANAFLTSIVTSSTSPRFETNTLSTSVYLWGAQIQEGATVTEYIPTTSVIRTRFAGITQDGGSASNIPRIDYSNGSCPSILVEPQRTNLCLQSEMFTQSPWAGNTIISANTDIAPNGTLTADTLTDSSTAQFRNLSQTISVSANSTIASSVFIKKTTGTPTNYPSISVQFTGGGARVARLILNTTTGTFTISPDSNITPIGRVVSYNDYWRIEMTTTDNGSNTSAIFRLDPALSSDGTTISLSATGSAVFWGAQLELGSNATSYIPTTTSSVTRNADVISKSGISNLIGQTEGTIYYNLSVNSINNAAKYIGLSDGTTNNRILIGHDTGISEFRLYYNSSGITSFTYTGSSWATGVIKKIAIVYATNNFKLFINGVLVYTNNSITTFNSNNLTIFQITGIADFKINTISLWKTALTNTQAIQLTTL